MYAYTHLSPCGQSQQRSSLVRSNTTELACRLETREHSSAWARSSLVYRSATKSIAIVCPKPSSQEWMPFAYRKDCCWTRTRSHKGPSLVTCGPNVCMQGAPQTATISSALATSTAVHRREHFVFLCVFGQNEQISFLLPLPSSRRERVY